MGGQACVLYGAAEFSRDTDLAFLASNENIELLRAALRELRAWRIALPPFEQHYLARGHAIHFRCYHPDAMNVRIDLMSVMRGVDPFEQLWERRMRFVGSEGESFDLLSLADLVRAGRKRYLRLMRARNLLAPVRPRWNGSSRRHDGTIRTDRPNRMWGTDAKQFWTRQQGPCWFFGLIDHWNDEILGWHASIIGDRFAALEPVHQAVKNQFGYLD